MSGIRLDHRAAKCGTASPHGGGEDHHRRHTAATPALPATAAGRAFVDRGAAIADALHRVHEHGARRIDALRATADAAAEQVDVFRDVDKRNADDLAGRS
ncbi:hypothetical protein QP028_04745 [Corynebacterium suedekumii]|nr:hypothetical protein QP028_04745 [Corynebacterium suedekumii]